MRTLFAFALILTSTFAFGQRNFNGFTSDFRNYDGLPPNCYTPTVGNLNGHLAGINNQLCQLYALIGQIENDTTLVNEIQGQIDSILGIIQVIDIQSADTSVIINQTGSTFNLSHLWGFGESTGCYETTVSATFPSTFDYVDTFGLVGYAIFCLNSELPLFFIPDRNYGLITPQELVDTIVQYFIVSDSITILKTSDTSFTISFQNTCDCDTLVFQSETSGNDYNVPTTISGDGVVVNNETFDFGGFGSVITFYEGNCIGSTNLDSILQYLINFYCQPEPEECCSGGVFNNSYQVLSGIGIFDMSATFADTNCISITQHTIIFDGDTLFNSFTPIVQYIGLGTWTTGDSIFVYSNIYVATRSNTPCDTVSQIDTIIVQTAEPPTVAVDDFVVIPRNACDTIAVTDNDVKPCGVASIAVLDSTSGISSVTIYNDSLLIICRSNFAFDTDTVTYLLTSNCGNPAADTGLVIVTANLQPQLPISVCYDGIDADNDEAQLTWNIAVPSGYFIPTNGILWQSTDESGGFTGYSLDSTSPTNILYGSSGSINLDSADIVIYVTLINIFTQLPIFYEVNLKLADGTCDTIMLDTTASPSFMYARNVQACFNFIGYQSGGTTLNINSGTIYRYSPTTVGIDSTIGLDSTYFLVDLTNSPCSKDSIYQSAIKRVPPYTLVDVDGDPVSVTSGVSVTFGTSSINVNGGVAISILSPIVSCSVLEFTQTWFFTWKGRTNTFTYAFDGVSFSGQCINLNGVILP